MSEMYKLLFGGSKPVASADPAGGSDFADFAGAADPSPVPFSAIPSEAGFAGTAKPTGVPFTRWYNVHERHSIGEFKTEGFILIAVVIIVAAHVIGTRINRQKANAWVKSHAPAMQREFALVGFGGREALSSEAGNTALGGSADLPIQLLKEKSLNYFSTYATGRQNVAFMDVNLFLHKRYNPVYMAVDQIMGFFIESMPAPIEKMEAILYPFDGKEALTVPGLLPGALEARKDGKSTYDGFVWAVVNKESMKQLRDERYDVSLTTTKDHPKLPIWATVMSESAEVTDLLLTPELIEAVKEAGEALDYLVISDQPIDKPLTMNETVPKKRIYLGTRLPSGSTDTTVPLFEYFLRLPDLLVTSAHFRPEVLRKVKSTRDDAIRRLQKADEEEKAEERLLEREKAKKLKRDLELKGLDAKAQKKYLDKEREKEMKKAQKRQTVKQ